MSGGKGLDGGSGLVPESGGLSWIQRKVLNSEKSEKP